MFLEKKQDGRFDINEYKPDVLTKRTFKITIEEVTVVETEEMETKYIHEETGKVISSYDYNYDDKYKEDKAAGKYHKVEVPTGKMTENRSENKIFEQEKGNLDVAEIAIYINRSK